MGRRFRGPVVPEAEQYRVNHRIRIPQILVIGPEGEQLGIMSPEEGRDRAAEYGMDLVEVAPQARPPVCKIMDYGKFKYDQAKKKSSNKSAQPEIKTVQLRPKTDDHDLSTKLNRAKGFLERGDKVRIVMRLRGREQAYPGRWKELMHEHVREYIGEIATITGPPSHQGRTISMTLEPNRSAQAAQKEGKKPEPAPAE